MNQQQINQQQVIQQSLNIIIRKNRIELLIKYIEIIIFLITLCFIKKNLQLYKFYKTSIIVFLQGIALNLYYSHLLHKHKTHLRNGSHRWIAPFNSLTSFGSDDLNNSLQFFHSNYYLTKMANWVFEIVLFLSAPYEFYTFLQTPQNSYSTIIIIEMILYFFRRVYILFLPCIKFLFCCITFTITMLFRRQQCIKNTSIYELKTEKVNGEKEDCIICLEQITDLQVNLECNHKFHLQCIQNWIAIKPFCPLCRIEIK